MLLGGTDSWLLLLCWIYSQSQITVKLLMAWEELSGAEKTRCKLQISVCVSQVSALTMS